MDNEHNNTQLEAQPAPTRNAITALTEQLGLVDSRELYGIICNTIMPGNAKPEEVAAFCMVCAQYHLNPLAREIYAFPNKQGGITPMVSIDGWLKLLHGHPDYDGEEFSIGTEDGDTWCECAIYSKSRPNRPTRIREYLSENMMKSSPVWQQRPKRMLRHRSMIQAVRYFGGYAGLADREEMLETELRNVTPPAKSAEWLGGEQQPAQKALSAPAAQPDAPAPVAPAPQVFEAGDEIPGLEEPRVSMSADEFGEEL